MAAKMWRSETGVCQTGTTEASTAREVQLPPADCAGAGLVQENPPVAWPATEKLGGAPAVRIDAVAERRVGPAAVDRTSAPSDESKAHVVSTVHCPDSNFPAGPPPQEPVAVVETNSPPNGTAHQAITLALRSTGSTALMTHTVKYLSAGHVAPEGEQQVCGMDGMDCVPRNVPAGHQFPEKLTG